MTTALSTVTPSTELAARAEAGRIANAFAAAASFADYAAGKSDNTLRAQRFDLAGFAAFLSGVGFAVTGVQLATEPGAWQGVTHGLLEAFKLWALREGRSIASINRALSTARTYAGLAAKAGTLATVERKRRESAEAYKQRVEAANTSALLQIRNVKGYSRKEGKRKDERRTAEGTRTRTGHKKASPVPLSKLQVAKLKLAQPDTPQGRRDALLMCLLLDHGLRVGEVAGLTVGCFDLEAGSFTFDRPKVSKVQTHKLSEDTAAALRAYVDAGDAPAFDAAKLLRGSRKGGKLDAAGMNTTAITVRVRVLGEAVGVRGLSAHDCRHAWATAAVKGKTDPFALRDAGGWASLTMPSRYVKAAEVANEAVTLSWG